MRKSNAKFALFISFACMAAIGAGLYFSIQLANKYSQQLSVFNENGEMQTQISNSYNYSDTIYGEEQTNNVTVQDAIAEFSYNNISFISYSESWNSAKLELLAHELFENTHGDEIAYVARVELHDDNYDEYAGLHRNSYEKYSLPIAINRLLPSDMTLDFSTLSSVIVLTGANENTTVESMARTLSHEYGHHFTQYYFGFTGTLADMATRYALLRNESGMPVYSVITDWDSYLDNHMWDLQEIAAEDYVYFMGSPTAKQQIDFLDNRELASLYASSEKEYNDYINQTMLTLNSYPHENPVLTAPSQVNGLAEYYYGFVDNEVPAYTELTPVYGDMEMSISQTAPGSYTMTWTNPWPYNIVSYTLVAYDSNDYILKPIKTISGDEDASAQFGIQRLISGQNEYTISDIIDTLGFVRFRIVAVFSDGTAVFSDPYDVTF